MKVIFMRVDSRVVYEFSVLCQNKQALLFEALVDFKKQMCSPGSSNEHFLEHFDDYSVYIKEDKQHTNLIYSGTILDIFNTAQQYLEGEFNGIEIERQLRRLFYHI